MPKPQRVNVFLSHSHVDRRVATTLQAVLEKYGASTFLDQDEIQAGDELPARIHKGIAACDALLLIWSRRASASAWVKQEWEAAWQSRKRIIPYKLDATALPLGLEDRVFVEADDRTRAHAALLKAVFGAAFAPNPTDLFPGKWSAVAEIPGIGRMAHDIELRANGQIEGVARMDTSGFLGAAAGQFGFTDVLTTPIPVHGEWTYDGAADSLSLTLTAEAYGRRQTDTIRIQATGRESGAIRGSDLSGRLWTLTRVRGTTVGASAQSDSAVDAARTWFEAVRQQRLEVIEALSMAPFYDGDGDGQVLRSRGAVRERYTRSEPPSARVDPITETSEHTVAEVRRSKSAEMLQRPASAIKLDDDDSVVMLTVSNGVFARFTEEQLRQIPAALRSFTYGFLLRRGEEGYKVYGYL